MDAKDIFYPLIILFFIIGLVIGYAIHRPETVQKIQYVDRTVEKVVEVTATPSPTSPTSTPVSTAIPIPDFTIKQLYDPVNDQPTTTMKLENRRAVPDVVSIHPGDSVSIVITASSVPGPITLVLGSYQRKLGSNGAVFITFNNKGTYNFSAIVPSGDPNILPAVYAEKGTIIVN